jgi:hypothetical protein
MSRKSVLQYILFFCLNPGLFHFVRLDWIIDAINARIIVGSV